jgi:multicomponent Na+:H+ antiporter subunit G
MTANVLSILFVSAGVFFFVSGTLGLLRFPDVCSRLHALTKADHLGLGLVVLGLVFQAPSLAVALKLVLVWIVAALSGSTACYVMAHYEIAGEEAHDGA